MKCEFHKHFFLLIAILKYNCNPKRFFNLISPKKKKKDFDLNKIYKIFEKSTNSNLKFSSPTNLINGGLIGYEMKKDMKF